MTLQKIKITELIQGYSSVGDVESRLSDAPVGLYAITKGLNIYKIPSKEITHNIMYLFSPLMYKDLMIHVPEGVTTLEGLFSATNSKIDKMEDLFTAIVEIT